MKVLITGGAGYIGSITNRQLQQSGFESVVYDNLSEGHKKAIGKSKFINGDLTDRTLILKIFQHERFDAVMHFAAKALTHESMKEPYDYFYNNIMGGLNLLEAMRINNCKKIIFSSSCSVYGVAKKLPITEDQELKSVSVYGETKKMFESILSWYDKIHEINSISLRYFNAAGATEDGKMGEDHKEETHIIPLAIQAAMGKSKSFRLYGSNYSTVDGTCIRDYIHVVDLADAHILALKKLMNLEKSLIYNLGSEKPYSNKEVISMIKKISGNDFPVDIVSRRKGDPAAVYADSARARQDLNWKPKYSSLETIVKTAWNWHKNHPNGYNT